jgi:hypothetical protein
VLRALLYAAFCDAAEQEPLRELQLLKHASFEIASQICGLRSKRHVRLLHSQQHELAVY